MSYDREQIAVKLNIREIARFLILFGLAAMLPFYIHIQWITGPIVNAILIIALFLTGIRSALLLCLVPSLIALSGGLLPAVLAPAVPFIMVSNVILVLSLEYFYTNIKNNIKGYWVGILIGAALKFLFLFGSIRLIEKLFINQDLVFKVAQMMSWPQFLTALAGGFLAWGFLKWLKRF